LQEKSTQQRTDCYRKISLKTWNNFRISPKAVPICYDIWYKCHYDVFLLGLVVVGGERAEIKDQKRRQKAL
jgi:hypothetical protein